MQDNFKLFSLLDEKVSSLIERYTEQHNLLIIEKSRSEELEREIASLVYQLEKTELLLQKKEEEISLVNFMCEELSLELDGLISKKTVHVQAVKSKADEIEDLSLLSVGSSKEENL